MTILRASVFSIFSLYSRSLFSIFFYSFSHFSYFHSDLLLRKLSSNCQVASYFLYFKLKLLKNSESVQVDTFSLSPVERLVSLNLNITLISIVAILLKLFCFNLFATSIQVEAVCTSFYLTKTTHMANVQHPTLFMFSGLPNSIIHISSASAKDHPIFTSKK